MPTPKYKISLSLPGLKPFSKTGKTILEALEALELPQFFKGKGIIQAKYGKLQAEVYMYPHQLRRLFINPTSKLLLQKRLHLALK